MEHALKKEMEAIDDLTKVTLKALRKKVRLKKNIAKKRNFDLVTRRFEIYTGIQENWREGG